jgi:hypothetical protein
MSYPEREILSTSVVVVDVSIGFWRLVRLMVKLFLASIPAMIIASFVLSLLIAGVFAVLTLFGFHPERLGPWLVALIQHGVATPSR